VLAVSAILRVAMLGGILLGIVEAWRSYIGDAYRQCFSQQLPGRVRFSGADRGARVPALRIARRAVGDVHEEQARNAGYGRKAGG